MEKVSESKLAAQKELTQVREEIKKLETEMTEKRWYYPGIDKRRDGND